MDINCHYCKGTGWRVVTTQGSWAPDGSGVYAATTLAPCECCTVAAQTLVPVKPWTRTGAIPKVTCSPSILTPRYHGFLRDGFLEEC